MSPDIRDLPGVLETFNLAPFGADADIVADECNIGVNIQPYALWTAMPTQQIVWRKPGVCRFEEEAKPVLGDWFDDLPLPIPDIEWRPSDPDGQDPWGRPYSTFQKGYYVLQIPDKFKFGGFVDIDLALVRRNPVWGFSRPYGFLRFIDREGREIFKSNAQMRNEDGFFLQPLSQAWAGYREADPDLGHRITSLIRISKLYWSWQGTENAITGRTTFIKNESQFRDPNWYWENKGQAQFWGDVNGNGVAQPQLGPWGIHIGIDKKQWFYFEHFNQWSQRYYLVKFPPTRLPPPPPIYPFPPMSCGCPSPRSQRALQQSLDEINKKLEDLEEISKKIGDAEFDVPTTFISTQNNPNPGNKKIENLTDFLGYVLERDDEFRGQWEIPIEIEDMEPFTEGQQKETIRIPNLAEAIADIWAAVTMTRLELSVVHQTAFNTMVETGQNFQMVWQNQKNLEAIIDYLGFNYKEFTEKILLLFDPTDESGEPAKYLQEKEIEAVGIQFDTNAKRNLQRDLLTLLHGAAVTRAAHWRPVDKKDSKHTLMRDIFSLILNRQNLEKLSPEEKKEFDEWFKDFTEGFPDWRRDTGDESYTEDFWGVPYSDRPKIENVSEKLQNTE
ncbi:MAG: hypothetical protein AAGA60_10715 [Cyanobacteria bacterium P01_E01_bin.42]